MTPINLTFLTGIVLQAIQDGHRYGFDIMDHSGLPDGTVYPALRRLEAGGFLRSGWEDKKTAHAEGRPPRRLYELTPEGVALLERARARFRGFSVASRAEVETPDPGVA